MGAANLPQAAPPAKPRMPDDYADRAFAEAMIASFENAMVAAKLMRDTGSDVLLLWLADAIIASHERDLDVPNDWPQSSRSRLIRS